MSVLGEYAKSAVNTALRIQERVQELEQSFSDIGRCANVLADCAELQELANRIYCVLYGRMKAKLPGALDPLTMRYRELGSNVTTNDTGTGPGKPARVAPGVETPARQPGDDTIAAGSETGTQ